MCGIAGIWNRDLSTVDKKELKKMILKLDHRGPDHSDILSYKDLAIGYTRLAINDLSTLGNQPFKNENKFLVFNGEIYNSNEIKKKLNEKNIFQTSNSDTEILFQFFVNFSLNEKSILDLNGMFAFAFFDSIKNELWLARDRLGIKPLYYTEINNKFCFASEIKSLLANNDVKNEPDTDQLKNLFYTGKRGASVNSNFTAFKNIKECKPGFLYKINKDRIQEIEYYNQLDIIIKNGIEKDFKKNKNFYSDKVHTTLKKAVKMQSQSDANLGTSISGGIDSTLISAHAKDNIKNLRGFSADLYKAKSEAKKAQFVSDELKIPLTGIKIDEELETIANAVYFNDEPLQHGASVSLFKFYQSTKKEGCKVLLSGEGADELFGGYSFANDAYETHPSKVNFFQKIKNIVRLKIADQNIFYPFEKKKNSHDRLIKGELILGQDDVIQNYYYDKLSEIYPKAEAAYLAVMLYELKGQLKSALHKVDRMSMANSLEVRVPYLDNDLVSTVMSINPKFLFESKNPKSLLKMAARKKLGTKISNYIENQKKTAMHYHVESYKKILPLLEKGFIKDIFRWDMKYYKKQISNILIYPKNFMLLMYFELWAQVYYSGNKVEELSKTIIKLNSKNN